MSCTQDGLEWVAVGRAAKGGMGNVGVHGGKQWGIRADGSAEKRGTREKGQQQHQQQHRQQQQQHRQRQ